MEAEASASATGALRMSGRAVPPPEWERVASPEPIPPCSPVPTVRESPPIRVCACGATYPGGSARARALGYHPRHWRHVPRCGHVEFFLDGVGEDHRRPEPE